MSASLDVTFCRHLLTQVHQDVRPVLRKWAEQHSPDLLAGRSVNLRKAAWVYGPMFRDDWEFHGPDAFYWHGEAANAYDARAKGWRAWLRKQGAPGYVLEDA